MGPLSDKITFIYMSAVAACVLTLGLLLPDAGAIVVAGGPARATIVAALLALFSARFPYPSLFVTLIIGFFETNRSDNL